MVKFTVVYIGEGFVLLTTSSWIELSLPHIMDMQLLIDNIQYNSSQWYVLLYIKSLSNYFMLSSNWYLLFCLSEYFPAYWACYTPLYKLLEAKQRSNCFGCVLALDVSIVDMLWSSIHYQIALSLQYIIN